MTPRRPPSTTAVATAAVVAATAGGGGGGVVNSFTPSNTPANQVPSFIESHPTSRSVAEGTASKTDIGAPVSATDGDNDKLTYSLGGTDSASFSIDTGTGPTEDRGEAGL